MGSTPNRPGEPVARYPDPGRDPDLDANLGNPGVSTVDAVAFFKEVNQAFSLSLKPEECVSIGTLRERETVADARAG